MKFWDGVFRHEGAREKSLTVEDQWMMLCDFPPTRNATKEQGKKEGAPAKPIKST